MERVKKPREAPESPEGGGSQRTIRCPGWLCPGGFPAGMPAHFPGIMCGKERGMCGMAGMPGLHENLSDPEVLAGTPDP